MPVFAEHPKAAPELAIRSWVELEGYSDIPKNGQLSMDKVRELRHGYYACVSYIDALGGRLLDRVAALKLEENTVVVLWGDHGWHLGEKQHWGKWTGWQRSTRVPLMILPPSGGATGRFATDAVCDNPVSLIDLYPTLLDLCGLPEKHQFFERLVEP